MSNYYEGIEILEAVKLDGWKEIFVKDFSEYFKVEIENWNLSEKIKEFIEDYLFTKLKDLNKFWILETKTEINVLNDRVYSLNIKEEKDEIYKVYNELEVMLKEEFNKDYKIENYIVRMKKILKHYPKIISSKKNKDYKIKLNNFILRIEKRKNKKVYFINLLKISNIKRKFDLMRFFQDHESLFSKENDFEKKKIKKLYLNLKDKNNNILNNLETKIANLSDKDKFYVKIKLEDKKNDIEYKKYNYVFFTERWKYYKWTLKNNSNNDE